MLVVAIVGILFTIGPQIFIQMNRFFKSNSVKIELQKEARTSLSIINRNLRQASASSIVIDNVSGQPFCSRIAFTKHDGTTFTFYQQNKKLIMSTSNTTKTLTENIRYLAFVPPRSEDLSIVSVSMTLEKDIHEARTKALHMASEKVMVMN